MQRLREDMKNHTFAPVYLLYGDEAYLKQNFKKQLKDAILGDDTLNFTSAIGKEADPKSIGEMAVTMPFLAEKRLILLEDTGLFKSSAEEWVDILDQLPETTCMVFVEAEIDKRNKLYKKVNSIGYCAELNHPDDNTLTRWVLGRLKQRNMSITRDAMERLLFCAEDMEMLANELEKLCDYTMGKEGITVEDVDAICSAKLSNRVFDMIEAMAAGNQKKALDLYYDLMALREPSMRILFLIARQFNQLMLVKEMSSAGKGRDGIASQLKIKPFIAGKLMTQSRSFTLAQLKYYVSQCVVLEEAVKIGNMNETMAVELLILMISEKRQMA